MCSRAIWVSCRATTADIILSSGGPGSPHDGFDDEAWCLGYRKFLDGVVEKNLKTPEDAPKAFLVCHSFEIAVLHFQVAEMVKRPTTKFGVMPAYITSAGQKSGVLRAVRFIASSPGSIAIGKQ